jgi:electron transfer flavoprotein alpha subunit
VRLIETRKHRPDLLAAALAAFETSTGADLYVFPGGPLGTELATLLATRTGGSVVSGVQWAEAGPDHLTCNRTAFSGHLTAAVELHPRPWCVALDASWTDAAAPVALDVPPPSAQDVAGGGGVETVALLTDDDSTTPPLEDVEHLERPRTGDLETARFLVVAGRGAGSRVGVERIAAAAARMGAAFGITRPVVMNAWAAPDRQIGVSGARVAPAVCVVAGASGAPAFIWGVERAGFIAAVDTDAQAPIAGEADAVLVDDAVAVVEALADIIAGARR